MELKGKITQLLEPQTGEGKNGTWKKQQVIMETFGEYPKKVCVLVWGEKIPASILKVGNEINASLDIESREYNGRWYTDVKVWKMDLLTDAKPETNDGGWGTANEGNTEPPMPTHDFDGGDLPF
jgi:outer membrane protein W